VSGSARRQVDETIRPTVPGEAVHDTGSLQRAAAVDGPVAHGDVSCVRRWRRLPVRDRLSRYHHDSQRTCGSPPGGCGFGLHRAEHVRSRGRLFSQQLRGELRAHAAARRAGRSPRVPAGARRNRRRARRVHRVRSPGLSRALAARCSGTTGARRRLRALSAWKKRPSGRVQEAQSDQARRLHRADGRNAERFHGAC
jgi:hypothetical protein